MIEEVRTLADLLGMTRSGEMAAMTREGECIVAHLTELTGDEEVGIIENHSIRDAVESWDYALQPELSSHYINHSGRYLLVVHEDGAFMLNTEQPNYLTESEF